MSSHDQRGPHAGPANVASDELDRLLSWGIQEPVGTAEPSPRVWQQIERKLRAGPSPARHRPRRKTWRTASLAQALALASLLVVLGLSLGPSLQWPYLHERDEHTDILTRTPVLEQVESGPLSNEEGLLSGRETLLLTGEQADERQVTVRDTFPDEVLLTSEEGLLSKREILALAREQAHERQVTARENSPGTDSILKHGHEWHRFEGAP